MTKTTPRIGRPALDEDGAPSTQVGVRLAPGDYDSLYKRATSKGLTVAEMIRRDIRRGAQHERLD